jgi:hypothetical protein
MADNCYEGVPLTTLWMSLMGRLAVCTGSLTALTSIWTNAPLPKACLRGGLAWFAILAIGKGVSALAARTAPSKQGSTPALRPGPHATPGNLPDSSDAAA